MDKICYLFLLFLLYSFFGWSMEVLCKLVEKKRFINRGFLIGPYCPIYGCGSILIILLLYKYKNDYLTLFVMSMILCTILEYLTSFLMEKLFSIRWWDYSDKKFNLNGRVCLNTMIPFGILGSVLLLIIHPFFTNILNKFNPLTLRILALLLFLIFISDLLISLNIITECKKTIKKVEKDATEEISKKVREILLQRSYLYRRLVKAFPNIKNHREILILLKNKINQEMKSRKKNF